MTPTEMLTAKLIVSYYHGMTDALSAIILTPEIQLSEPYLVALMGIRDEYKAKAAIEHLKSLI